MVQVWAVPPPTAGGGSVLSQVHGDGSGAVGGGSIPQLSDTVSPPALQRAVVQNGAGVVSLLARSPSPSPVTLSWPKNEKHSSKY